MLDTLAKVSRWTLKIGLVLFLAAWAATFYTLRTTLADSPVREPYFAWMPFIGIALYLSLPLIFAGIIMKVVVWHLDRNRHAGEPALIKPQKRDLIDWVLIPLFLFTFYIFAMGVRDFGEAADQHSESPRSNSK